MIVSHHDKDFNLSAEFKKVLSHFVNLPFRRPPEIIPSLLEQTKRWTFLLIQNSFDEVDKMPLKRLPIAKKANITKINSFVTDAKAT
jgi:hypothetical protein